MNKFGMLVLAVALHDERKQTKQKYSFITMPFYTDFVVVFVFIFVIKHHK